MTIEEQIEGIETQLKFAKNRAEQLGFSCERLSYNTRLEQDRKISNQFIELLEAVLETLKKVAALKQRTQQLLDTEKDDLDESLAYVELAAMITQL